MRKQSVVLSHYDIYRSTLSKMYQLKELGLPVRTNLLTDTLDVDWSKVESLTESYDAKMDLYRFVWEFK